MFSFLGSTWGALTGYRASLYELGWLKRYRLERPVISVGALSVGGAGKTPTAALIAALLAESGVRPAILSRGYRRAGTAPLLVSHGDGRGPLVDATRAGDEPFWMATTLPAVPVAVASHREDAAHLVLTATRADVFILDDGYQHLRVDRDANLLVVNPEHPFWNDEPMPSGRLRESPGAASRADAFLVVGPDDETTTRLRKSFPERALFELASQPPRCWPIDEPIPAATAGAPGGADIKHVDAPAFAFAGIARPQRFFDDLLAAGIELRGQHTFADHHEFSSDDLATVVDKARECGAEKLLTTEKDAVRLAKLTVAMPVLVWGYRLQATEPADLVAWLKDRIGFSSLPDAA